MFTVCRCCCRSGGGLFKEADPVKPLVRRRGCVSPGGPREEKEEEEEVEEEGEEEERRMLAR